MPSITDSAFFAPVTTAHRSRDRIAATPPRRHAATEGPMSDLQSNDFTVATSEKAQSTTVKLEILRTTCADQAIQAAKAGRLLDAAEWRHLHARIARLA